ncbi:unnamed protein product [Phytomonas sp. Hart1]|nr:unnamed protein product [Phytomonas sp. Hart1]|eukprot:CCW70523.1 unnamed protein product [Phytomonas sp. isolate Hart1]
MYAVSISLGACSAFVGVTYQTGTGPSASVSVVANAAGRRRTPTVAALAGEWLFGDNALQVYPRNPHRVVPYVFLYAAAAAALRGASHPPDAEMENAARLLLRSVEGASRVKFLAHCPVQEEHEEALASGEGPRLGFYFEKENGEDVIKEFVSAEDLFVDFLSYIKEHVIDGACGLASAGGDRSRSIFLTLTVPRGAFPAAASAASSPDRECSLMWLRKAVRASTLGGVCGPVSILFNDESSLFAVEGALTSTSPQANFLVVDWGAHGLALDHLRTAGGLRVRRGDHDKEEEGEGGAHFSSSITPGLALPQCCAGDWIDAAMADCVAAQFILKNSRMFPIQLTVARKGVLTRRLANFLDVQCDQQSAATILAECIPARSLNRLRLAIEERKVVLSTNPTAHSSSVEVEAFYEGVDLQDNQTLSRNKFESAIGSINSLAGVFNGILHEFTERFAKQLKNYPINYVLLTGGMHNIPAVVQMVQKAIRHPTSPSVSAYFDLPALRFLDNSVLGNGIGADELAAVGACFNSSQIALLDLQKVDVRRKLSKRNKRKKKSKGLGTIALQESEESLSRIWSSLSLEDGGEAEDDDDNHEHTHVRVLKHNVYAFVGENAALRFSSLTLQGKETVELGTSELSCLFPYGTPLPSRVIIGHEASEESLILYLFSDLSEELNSGDEHFTSIRVRPVYLKGVVIPPLDGSISIILTLRCTQDGEGEERVSLVVATTRKGVDDRSTLFTPHNTNECAVILLY